MSHWAGSMLEHKDSLQVPSAEASYTGCAQLSFPSTDLPPAVLREPVLKLSENYVSL